MSTTYIANDTYQNSIPTAPSPMHYALGVSTEGGVDVPSFFVGGFAFSHSFNACSKLSHTSLPATSPPNSPSSGNPCSSPLPFPLSDVDAGSSLSGSGGEGTCRRTTAHSRYNAPGLRISSGSAWLSIGEPSEAGFLAGMLLKGVGRKSACKMDWSAELGDLTTMRRRGWKRMYLDIRKGTED